MYIYDMTAYILGGYSWSEGRIKKLLPVTMVTRIHFSADFQILRIDVIPINDPEKENLHPEIEFLIPALSC